MQLQAKMFSAKAARKVSQSIENIIFDFIFFTKDNLLSSMR